MQISVELTILRKMLRIIFQTLAGLILLVLGCFLAYLYLQELAETNKWWLFVIGICLATGGVFFLFRAGKSDATVVSNNKFQQVAEEKKGLETKLLKNNKLMSEWSKTEEARDRLRMLELSASADKEQK